MTDFKRDRRKSERDVKVAGGLPRNDLRQENKKAYGEADGKYIGFMDDLTPCRVKKSTLGRPWFRLNSQFMDVKKNRCFSGPPTHWGYCAENLDTAKKLFFWYALARTFVQTSYPMWVDADDIWAPAITDEGDAEDLYKFATAIAYAENQCVEAWFPANNPIDGTPLLYAPNPLTPLAPDSFWSLHLRHFVRDCRIPSVARVLAATDNVFHAWDSLFGSITEIPVDFDRPYFIGRGTLRRGAGLIQIRDYATETHSKKISALLTLANGELT